MQAGINKITTRVPDPGNPDRLSWSVSLRPTRITVPERANPLAKLVFSEMQRQHVTYSELEHRSGVLTSTFKAWRVENRPGLASIEAALGALGWALVPVPRMERVPQWVKDRLDEINAEWGREEPLLHHLLASACLAPILVEGAEKRVSKGDLYKRVRLRRPIGRVQSVLVRVGAESVESATGLRAKMVSALHIDDRAEIEEAMVAVAGPRDVEQINKFHRAKAA